MGKRLADGTWKDTCLDKVKPEEPIFVLRAQDKLAPHLVYMWAKLAKEHGCPLEKVKEAEDCAEAMFAWPNRKYPD
jgi:hypothetical protein